ncbi:MAG TPA: hypothetical protein VFW65_08515 [Pseudonocardiaceae bacterium]|nr:hypothetical protein [Pseudonocardiaceae bacterium]
MKHVTRTDGDVVAMTDKARARCGYLGLAETCDLALSGNVVLDPWSVLISRGRYLSGAQVVGRSTLGGGSQILGPIAVQDCTLAAGGSYREANPDDRGPWSVHH